MTQACCGPGRVPIIQDLCRGQEVLTVSSSDQVDPVPGIIDEVSAGVGLSALHQIGEVHHPALLVVHVHLGPAHPARDNDTVLQLNGARVTRE